MAPTVKVNDLSLLNEVNNFPRLCRLVQATGVFARTYARGSIFSDHSGFESVEAELLEQTR